ncbi:4187_t:CDS:1, partial [Cetraspora pellucida]
MSRTLSDFDALVLGSYKDGSLTDTAAKEIPENLQRNIQEQFQYSGLKGKLGEVRMFYGLGGDDANIPKKIAVVALGINKGSEQSHDVSEALEITRKA